MTDAKQLSSSLEDYLEAILVLIEETGTAKAKDIARKMNVKMPSVTGALKSLAEKGLVNYTPYNAISLTKEGTRVAREVYLRHRTLTEFLNRVLDVDLKSAEKAACALEHAVSTNILERLIAFIRFTESCPQGGATWVNGNEFRCNRRRAHPECKSCASLQEPYNPV